MDKNFEINEVLQDCTERFDKIDISYMLTGSMAMVYYAQPRTTVDIDIVIAATTRDTGKIISIFEPDYYIPHDGMERAVRQNSMFNMIHQESVFKVDCILQKNDEFQKKAFANRQKVGYAGFEIWIISKEDLVLAKLNWARNSRSERQFLDVENIVRSGINKEYLEDWSAKLGITNLLQEIYARLK